MKNIIRSIQSKRGEGYIDVTITVLAALMVILIGINTFSLMIQKQNLDYFAHELMRTAEQEGNISGGIEQRMKELQAETGIVPTEIWNTTYFNAADKTIQLQTPISLILELNTRLKGIGNLVSVPVVLRAKVSGCSQKYWK